MISTESGPASGHRSINNVSDTPARSKANARTFTTGPVQLRLTLPLFIGRHGAGVDR